MCLLFQLFDQDSRGLNSLLSSFLLDSVRWDFWYFPGQKYCFVFSLFSFVFCQLYQEPTRVTTLCCWNTDLYCIDLWLFFCAEKSIYNRDGGVNVIKGPELTKEKNYHKGVIVEFIFAYFFFTFNIHMICMLIRPCLWLFSAINGYANWMVSFRREFAATAVKK